MIQTRSISRERSITQKKRLPAHRKRLEKKLSDLQAKEIAQWEAQADPDPGKRMPQHVFQALNVKLLKEKDEVVKALNKAYESMPGPIDYSKKIITLQDALNALRDSDISAAEKNKFLKACIDRIEYHREKPQRVGKCKSDIWDKPLIEISVKLCI